MVEHKRGIEQTLFWGARDFDTSSSSEPLGFCGGLVEYISTNVDNAGGTLTEANLEAYLRDGLQHGSRNKVLFVAPVVKQAISGFLRDSQAPGTLSDTKWGAKVDDYISGAYGYQIPVVVKKDWNDFSTASSQYGGWAFGVDMSNVRLRPLRGRNTKLLRDRQANDADETTHEFLTEVSLEVAQEKTHFIFKGVTG